MIRKEQHSTQEYSQPKNILMTRKEQHSTQEYSRKEQYSHLFFLTDYYYNFLFLNYYFQFSMVKARVLNNICMKT